MSYYDRHIAALVATSDRLGDDCPQFGFAGNQYRCIIDPITSSKKLELGGFELSADTVIYCEIKQFGNNPLPKEKQLIQLDDGMEYRVANVVQMDHFKMLRLDLKNRYSGT